MNQVVKIWKCFHQVGLKYITIGGFAVTLYGYNRNTTDIDIFIEDTKENRIKLRKALKVIGIGDFEEIEHLQFIPGWTDFTLDYGMRLDIMTQVKGLENQTFDALLKMANIVIIEEIPVNFIDYKNLIVAKKAANRPKDLLDIDELEKLNIEMD